MKRRVIGIVASIFLAVVGTFILVAYVRGAEQRALAGEETVDVFVVDRPIAAGTAAETIANRVRTETVPVKVRASGAVADLTDLEGKVAAVDLVAGEQLVSTRFTTAEVLALQREVEVPEGLLEVTVSLAPERAVGGVLRPGSTVAVLASFEPFDVQVGEPGDLIPGAAEPSADSATSGLQTPNSTHIILHKVLVTNVQTTERAASSGVGLGSSSSSQEGDSSGDVPRIATDNLLVTLAVDAPSVEKVVFTAEHGYVWLAVEPEAASEAGTTIQTRGTVYR